jgi:RNA polymerase sigma-70 factor (family 1)
MTHLSPTDTELLDLFKNGDAHAFNRIYDRYCGLIYNTSVKILNDTALAQDVVQETFISLFEKGGLKTINNLQAYLFQTAKYQCFMHLRADKISEKHLHRINTILASNTLEEEFDAKELQVVLDKSISALPDRCREVFYLSRFELLSNKKIAERLHISHKTVENQISKALKILHTSVDKLGLFILLIIS